MSYLDKFVREEDNSLEALSTKVLESLAKQNMNFTDILIENIKDTHYGKVYENEDILLEANSEFVNNVSKMVSDLLTNNMEYYNTIGMNVNKFKEGTNKALLMQTKSPYRKISPTEVKIHDTSLFLTEEKGCMQLILTNDAMGRLITSVKKVLNILSRDRYKVTRDYNFDKLNSELDHICNEFYGSVLRENANREDYRKKLSKISNRSTKNIVIEDLSILKNLDSFLSNADVRYSKTIISNNKKLDVLMVEYEKSKIQLKELRRNNFNPKEKPDLAAINKFERLCYTRIYQMVADTKIAISYDICILNNAMDDIRYITNAIIKTDRKKIDKEVTINGDE